MVVALRSLLQDRMAALNGRTVEYVLKQDKQAFIRLIGLSIAQVGACLCLSFSLSASWLRESERGMCVTAGCECVGQPIFPLAVVAPASSVRHRHGTCAG